MDEFVELVKKNYQDTDLILNAYEFAKNAHKNEKRLSGEPYIIHPVAVASYLIELGLDEETIAAALLHDVVEDTPTSFKKIGELFGEDVEKLVKGVSKINSIKYNKTNINEMDSLKRLFIAMSKDIRVILIKLADRLHNIRTVKSLPYERQIKFCTETMNLFVPLAERLGLNNMKAELEDRCFEVLQPEEYTRLKNELDRKFEKNQVRMSNIREKLEEALKNLNLKGEIQSRFKHFYSLYKKIKDKGTAKIYDIIAFRVLVENVDDCYKVLGEIHKYYRPVPLRIKDYIAAPKANGYRSLHTTLLTKDGTPFEVQIRTFAMHQFDEFGIASHWRYKTGDTKKDIYEDKLNWIKNIIENEKQIKDSENFIKAVQMDFSTSEIWVFTPKYKPISLPEKSTPIDMAYAVHTDLGNTCVGARVNGRRVPLNRQLETGDVVEIITRSDACPSREWLKIAVSTNARGHIRAYFRKTTKPENIKKGREMLEKKASELKIPMSKFLSRETFENLNKRFLIYSIDDMFASLASGTIKVTDVLAAVEKQPEEEIIKPNLALVRIEGSDMKDVKFAHCCSPVPGDDICAVATNNIVTIHTASCPALEKYDKESYLSAEWKQNVDNFYNVSLKIQGNDRVGLLASVINVIYENNISICSLSAKTLAMGKFEILVTINVKNKVEIDDLIGDIEKTENVKLVTRNILN